MGFCKSCGHKLVDGTAFCKNCGSKLVPSAGDKELASGNGQTKAPRNSSHQQSVSPNRAGASAQQGKKRNVILVSALFIFITMLIGGGVGGYFYVESQSRPTLLVDAFTAALNEQDASALSKYVTLADSSRAVAKSEWQRLLVDLHADPEFLEDVLFSIDLQQRAVLTGKELSEPPLLFELQEQPERKWWVIKQYEFKVQPINLQVLTDKSAELYVNKTEIRHSGEETRSMDSLLPGTYHFKTIKQGEFATFEKEKTLTFWSSPKDSILLEFDERFITVSTSQAGADLYINGKAFGKFVDENMVIGPLTAEQTLTLQAKYSYPSGDVYTEKVIAGGNENVTMKIPEEPEPAPKEEPATTIVESPFNDGVVIAVMDTVYSYNTSYIQAITDLDTDLLRDAKGPQLKEATDIVIDLRRRNIYYIGRLVEMKFDAESFAIKNEAGVYKASVAVEETYMSGWKDINAQSAPALQQKKYYYTYYCEYDPITSRWIVTNNKEHKGLNIKDPVYY